MRPSQWLVASLFWLTLGSWLAACATTPLDEVLAGKACGPGGECAPEYECDPVTNTCVPEGTASGQGGSGGTTSTGGGGSGGEGGVGGEGGEGGEGGCTSVTDCPEPPTPCETPVCLGGQCGTVAVQSGTVLDPSHQVAGDCQLATCDGAGGILQKNDDADLPVDGSDCTEDLCTEGMASNPPLAVGTVCTTQNGTGVCDDTGTCLECVVAGDCVGLPPDDECQQRTCTSGLCGQTFTAVHTPLSVQQPGDCEVEVCDGSGGTQLDTDDNDVPVDNNDCTQDVCSGGTPSNPAEAQGTTCGGNLTCDGNGACVGCNNPNDCGSDTFCVTYTCAANQCGQNNTAADTELPSQTGGDCLLEVCDGNGGTTAAIDDDDLPTDDGNECTDEVCVNGVPGHPDKPLDAVCTNGGNVCDGQGACVDCNSPGVCAQGAPCQTATCTSNTCGLDDTANGTPAPSSEQTAADCTLVECDGNGGTTTVADAGDLPIDNNACTDDVCTGMAPSNPPFPQGTSCPGGVCDGQGTCSALLPNGDPCGQGSQCSSTYCADGYCCDTSCGGLCEACANALSGGADGQCAYIPAGHDPEGECPVAGEECSGTGLCVDCLGHVYSQGHGAQGIDIAHAVALDSTGAAILVGEFENGVDFGGGTLTSAGASDVFVVKLDSAGNHLWSQRFGDGDDDRARAVAVDGSNHIYVTGVFEGDIDFGGGTLSSFGGDDVFLAKLDSSGNHLWSQRYGDAVAQGESSVAHGVAVDSGDNVLITGEFFEDISFGGATLSASGDEQVFVAKLDAAGVHQWSNQYGPAGDLASGYGIAAAGTDVVITGRTRGAIDFGGGLLAHGGKEDVFVAKLDASGTHLWSHVFGVVDDDRGIAVAVDGSANVLLTGSHRSSVDFGGGPLVSPGGSFSVFVVKLNAAGGHLWSQTLGSSDAQIGRGVTTDPSDNVLVVGEAAGTVDFGGGPLASAGAADVFLVTLDASGNHLCSRLDGAGNAQVGRGVAADAQSNVAIVGSYQTSIQFGATPLPNATGDDAFVAKLGP